LLLAWSFASGKSLGNRQNPLLCLCLPLMLRQQALPDVGKKLVGSMMLGRAFLAALGLFGLLAVLFPSAAHAQAQHARLVQSDPADGSVLQAAPDSVRLRFSEPVQLAGHPITIFAPSGKEVERGPVQAKTQEVAVGVDAQEQGTYLVIWQVISLDTDAAGGRFIFSVGKAAGQWTGSTAQVGSFTPGTLLAGLARWLYFAGYALSFGALAFRWLIVRSLALKEMTSIDQRLWRLVDWGLLALVAAAPLALLAQLVSLSSRDLFNTAVIGSILASRVGWVLAQRLGGALLLWVLMGALKQGARLALPLALALGIALALVESEASHTISSSNVVVGVIATTLHVLAMGVWVGGLVALIFLWRDKAIAPYRREMITRFGQIALVALVELAGSGVLLAWLHLGQLSDLFTTAYGQTLLIKLLILPVALGMALLGRQQQRRERWWQGEALALAAVLALAGLLISLAPPR
jgi:copper transport protein